MRRGEERGEESKQEKMRKDGGKEWRVVKKEGRGKDVEKEISRRKEGRCRAREERRGNEDVRGGDEMGGKEETRGQERRREKRRKREEIKERRIEDIEEKKK